MGNVVHEQTSTGHLSRWAPTSGSTMTQTELHFCKDITDVVTRRKVHKVRDKHYRWIKYSSEEGERINCSSVILCTAQSWPGEWHQTFWMNPIYVRSHVKRSPSYIGLCMLV